MSILIIFTWFLQRIIQNNFLYNKYLSAEKICKVTYYAYLP